VISDTYPVQWTGRQAVVTLPEHIDASNVAKIREQLLALINRGAAVLIVDMAETVSCDHGGADALVRAYHRAAVSGTQLRLVVTAQIVRRVLEVSGLDRLVSIYPTLGAAIAAGETARVVPLTPGRGAAPGAGQARQARQGDRAPSSRWRRAEGRETGPRSAVLPPAVLMRVVDALADGVALTDDDGALVLVNRRLEEMFGYAHGELIGRPVESLLPADLRAVHVSHRAGYAQQPRARPMGVGQRLVGLRKDQATFPIEISLSPVPTATGRFTLAVVRDLEADPRRDDLADLARATVAAVQARRNEELLDQVVNSLFDVGLSLQVAIDLPHDEARERIAGALRRLDDTIREIRDHAFAARELPENGYGVSDAEGSQDDR
jgi:anti-anti-sigma factor